MSDDTTDDMPTDRSAERRQGPAERRRRGPDRRNAERIAEDLTPRRNPELPDRRKR